MTNSGTWWAVTSTYDIRGRVTAAITGTVEAKTRPASTFKETRAVDIYVDYYPTRQKAEQAVTDTFTAYAEDGYGKVEFPV